MPNLRSLLLCALSVVLLCNVAMAQAPAPRIRIIGQINQSRLVALRGNVHPLANADNDRGAVGSGLAMSGMTLVLSRTAEQQAAFDAFVDDQYDPGSPSYHQWLTPAQIGERFGPAESDISTISSWLSSQGFAVTNISPDRMTINFTGTAGQVQSAFHTAIHNLSVNGKAHIANMTDPQIPEALSAVVSGIKGLHNFRPHPLHRISGKVQIDTDGKVLNRLKDSPAASLANGGVPASVAAPQAASSVRPLFTYTSSGSSIPVEDVGPYDFATIYNVLPLWQKSTPVNGSGQIITVIGTSDINVSDVATFKSVFGLPAGLTPIMAHPTTAPGVCTSTTNVCGIGDLEENTLDVEWAGAVAPGAQVVLVTSPYSNQTNPTNDPIFDSAQWVVNNVNQSGSAVYGSRIMSVSYGLCELAMGTGANVAYRNLWQTAASAGIAVFVASGDSGSPACDQGGDADGYPYSAQYGLTVNGLASTAYNTAVGGTQFAWCKPVYNSTGALTGCSNTTAAPYWSTTNNGTNRSNALGYVPERPWNDSCLDPIWAAYLQSLAPFFSYGTPSNPEAACNYVYNNWKAINQTEVTNGNGQFVLAPFVDTIGAGGGASSCIVGDQNNSSSCSTSTTSTGSFSNLPLVNDGWPKPSWQAGVTGIPADGVRDIPDVSFFAGDGALQSATLVCVAAAGGSCTATNLGSTALEIGGTSIGAPQMAGIMALINQNAGSPQGSPNAALYRLATRQNYSSCSTGSGATSNGCYFNDVDQGTITMPCAVSTATLEGGANYNGSTGQYNVNTATKAALASPNCVALNSGDKVGTLVSSDTTRGYDATLGFDLATGLGSMNVANVVNAAYTWALGSAVPSLTVTPASTSIASDSSLSVSIAVTGTASTPSGYVSITSGTYSSVAVVLSGGVATITIPANSLSGSTSPFTATITAIYSGDSSYAPATGSAQVSVRAVTFELAPISSATVTRGSKTTATATVSSSNGYTGAVTVTCTLSGGPSTSNAPACAPSGAATLSASTTSAPITLTISTTAATAAVTYPRVGEGSGAGSGMFLALVLFLGIPACRRSWRTMLGLVLLSSMLSMFSGCVAKTTTTSNTNSTTASSGTTTGTYTFIVTATGNPATATSPSQTFTVTVN